ncbi:hypothetical protein EAX61_02155 [Dokdonia sinensis]|uniref:Uncharacterized protein n=1 Tax=Dokdonia sinensis TaxID=2479847 RepID=A0A3M0GFZ6_9FLAO|nr:hypothetical protein [Dokdonia sinensis]RMB63218.1 hypothetical protein EAX61_02155 [Dokdonia sinensis]
MKLVSTTYKVIALRYFEIAEHKVYSDWATEMLIAGFDSENLGRLAGVEKTFNEDALSELVRKVLSEFKVELDDESLAIQCFIRLRIQQLLDNMIELETGLFSFNKACLKTDYDEELMPFYLLYHAYISLKEEEIQFY